MKIVKVDRFYLNLKKCHTFRLSLEENEDKTKIYFNYLNDFSTHPGGNTITVAIYSGKKHLEKARKVFESIQIDFENFISGKEYDTINLIKSKEDAEVFHGWREE